jgi:MerR family transcriptional regulator, copper efflux regulator
VNVERASFSPKELAERAGISTDTLRHYERKGLLDLPARTKGGYRRYPPEALARVLLIRRALHVGFSLAELGSVLRERARGGAPCHRVRARVRERLAAADLEIEALQALKKELRGLLRDWDERLARTPGGRQARLLETLVKPDASRR